VVDVHTQRFARVTQSFSEITGYGEEELKLLTFDPFPKILPRNVGRVSVAGR
jgi:hypothetical protein